MDQEHSNRHEGQRVGTRAPPAPKHEQLRHVLGYLPAQDDPHQSDCRLERRSSEPDGCFPELAWVWSATTLACL